ncbi:MAG: YraN family protein [Gammaproteobacteria bacterium]|jgi:putative endonuclease|nr:YraN family protein [Gammaproteobacteria bacterium]
MSVHWSEDLAAAYLRCRGLTLLRKNYRCRRGEIDLVMLDSSCPERTLVFVEVRYRKTTAYGAPQETITRIKQNRIIAAATHFLAATNALHCTTRFDVIAVTRPHYLPNVHWIKDAFV